MPEHVVNLAAEGLNRNRKAVNGSRVLVLGVAYKKDIDDMRESPALAIIDQLRQKGADVVYHDPFVADMSLDSEHGTQTGERMASVELTDAEIEKSDCVVIVTNHSDVDYERVLRLASLVVDTRNVTAGLVVGDDDKVIRL